MGNGTDAELDQEAVVLEDLVLEEDLLDQLLRAADERCAVERARGLEVLALQRPPAALPTDPVHHQLLSGKRDVCRLLRGLCDEAVRVDAERRRRNVSGLDRGAA